MARRAASICRFVIQQASTACRANCPNEMVFPRLAIPLRRPFWTLRCLTRLGRSIVTPLLTRLGRDLIGPPGRRGRGGVVRRGTGVLAGGPDLVPSVPRPGALGPAALTALLRPGLPTPLAAAAAATPAALATGLLTLAGSRTAGGLLGPGCGSHLLPRGRLRGRLGELLTTPQRDVAPVDPHLDADHPERRPRRRLAELDVGPQRVERHPALAIPLTPGHLRPTQTTTQLDPDAPGAGPHGAQDRLLHRPPMADPPLQLRGDVLGHQLGIELGLLDLLDGDANPVAELFLQILAQLIDGRPALADHDARLGGMDGDRHLGVGRALGLDPGDARVAQPGGDQAPHLEVFVEELGVVLPGGEPVRLPAPVDPESKRVRVDLVTQWTIPPRWPRPTSRAARALRPPPPAPPASSPGTAAGPTGRRPAPGAPRPRP